MCLYAEGIGILPLAVLAIKPICIKYGSYTSSTVSGSSPIVVAIVSIPIALPLYFIIIVSNIFLSISSKPISSISSFPSAVFAIFNVIFP